MDEVDDLRARCLGFISDGVVELGFSFMRAGRESSILLICSSRAIDGEAGNFALVGEAGIVGRDVSRPARPWSEKRFEEPREESILCLERLFFMAEFKGGLDV
jgi:hypothetical protein